MSFTCSYCDKIYNIENKHIYSNIMCLECDNTYDKLAEKMFKGLPVGDKNQKIMWPLIQLAIVCKLNPIPIKIKSLTSPIDNIFVSEFLQKQNGDKWILEQLDKNMTKSEFIEEISDPNITEDNLKNAKHIKNKQIF